MCPAFTLTPRTSISRSAAHAKLTAQAAVHSQADIHRRIANPFGQVTERVASIRSRHEGMCSVARKDCARIDASRGRKIMDKARYLGRVDGHALVLGGSGGLGSEVVRALVAAGASA